MKSLYVQTFGCQMNQSDSDRMKATLAPLGFQDTLQPEQADVVLINTCSIREKAENKLSSFAYDLKKLKSKNPQLLIGVTGCVAQQEKERILEELPFVDLVMGPDNIDELPWALEALSENRKKKILKAEFDVEPRVWNTQTRLLNPGVTAFISIMKGCDHFCSYCVVPYTRGREKSRPIVDIVADVAHLVSQGVREITFLGQNINTFGKRTQESLHELFYRVHDIEGLKRIRFTTSHPGDLKDELIQCFEKLPKLCSYFHLPVQSGSDRVLRSMRRFYTRAQYLDRIKALRQVRPDMAFSTDMIIGFPGETEEDFQLSCSLMQEVKYDNAYSFVFSPRPGTSAAQREDHTSEIVKLERLTRFQKLQQGIARALHESEVNHIHEILIEGPSKKDPSKFTGRTSQNIPTHIQAVPGIQTGDLVKVKIVQGTLTHFQANVIPSTPLTYSEASA